MQTTRAWTADAGTLRRYDGVTVTLPGRAGYRYVDAYGEHFVDGELLMMRSS